MAECLKLPRPMMGGGARFDPDKTRRKLLKEREHVATLELTAKHNLPIRIDAMNLKHRLRDIEADGGNRLHLAPPNHECPNSTHIDGACRAGGGAVHSIRFGLLRCNSVEAERLVPSSTAWPGGDHSSSRASRIPRPEAWQGYLGS